ncbi:3'-phosphoadenylsulfate reductase [Thecaphora frezii]
MQDSARGPRRSQAADCASLNAVEVDETGLVKVDALLNWLFGQLVNYATLSAVPCNELLDLGYTSAGDWHSTTLPATKDAERSDRCKEKGGKTECGLLIDCFELKNLAENKQREAERPEATATAAQPVASS